MPHLRDVGEHAWIERLLRRLERRGGGRRGGVVVGPGDDAAVVRAGPRPMLLTTDTLVENVHFRRGWLTAGGLGRRAFAVNASDIAAMGGVPRFALLALEAPGRTAVAELDAIAGGVAAAAAEGGARLVGGNLAAGPHLAVTVALVGEAPHRVVRRSGARPGDLVYVTGALGAAGVAVRRLRAGRRGRLPEPPRRVSAGVALARVASAMIDVSDGLVQDAGHLARASGVAVEIELAHVPVAGSCARALGGRAEEFAVGAGEDYELLLTVPSRHQSRLGRLARGLGCPLTRIGWVAAGPPAVRVRGRDGRPISFRRAGFDHYRP